MNVQKIAIIALLLFSSATYAQNSLSTASNALRADSLQQENINFVEAGMSGEKVIWEAVGTKNMDKLFKFLADNTDVEWSLVSYETGKGHKDIVATSHDGNYVDVYNNEGKELGGMDLLDLASRTHSHVDGDKKPSGWNPSDSYKDNKGNVYMIESDRRTALNISNKFKESNKTPPRFYMYHVPSKSTIRYDGNKVYY